MFSSAENQKFNLDRYTHLLCSYEEAVEEGSKDSYFDTLYSGDIKVLLDSFSAFTFRGDYKSAARVSIQIKETIAELDGLHDADKWLRFITLFNVISVPCESTKIYIAYNSEKKYFYIKEYTNSRCSATHFIKKDSLKSLIVNELCS